MKQVERICSEIRVFDLLPDADVEVAKAATHLLRDGVLLRYGLIGSRTAFHDARVVASGDENVPVLLVLELVVHCSLPTDGKEAGTR